MPGYGGLIIVELKVNLCLHRNAGIFGIAWRHRVEEASQLLWTAHVVSSAVIPTRSRLSRVALASYIDQSRVASLAR